MVESQSMSHIERDLALLRRLQVFRAVVEQGGVGDAARALSISQPAVSTHVRNLEAELGTSLFRRTGRKLVVNDRGADLLSVLPKGLWELRKTLNSAREVAGAVNSPLRFGFSAPQTALEAAQLFREQDATTRLDLRVANTADLFEALDSYQLDVIMIGLDRPAPGYACQFFKRQHVSVMLPCDHRLAGQSDISLNQLARLPLVLRESGSFTRKVLLAAFETAGLTPNIAFEVATREAVAEAVRRGFGVGPVLSEEAERSPDLTLLSLQGRTIHSDDFLVCHTDSMRYGPIRRFFQATSGTQPRATDAADPRP